MIMKRLLACAAALLSCAWANGATAEPIKIGYLPLNSHVAFYADELGLFKKYGLDVEVKPFQTGPSLVQAIIAGDYQIGEIAVPPMIHLATQGLPVYFLATGGVDSQKYPAGAIMIRADDDSIKSFKDLKGKKIGQLAAGTLTYLRLFTAARHYGLERNDFHEVFVGFPQMGGLLASKQVDAVYTWPPFDTLIAQSGQGKVLVDDSAWIPYAVSNGMVAGQAWADKNPDLVKKLCMVWIEAARQVGDHPDEARRIMSKRLHLTEAVAKAVRVPYWPRNGYQLMPSIWDTYYLMLNTKQIKASGDPAAIIRQYWIKPAERWIAPALKEIGTQPDAYADALLKIKLPNLPETPDHFVGPWRH
jgi:ABC-type nitrate/sulfonate/bicarbonate transport system substrate-binding protein